MLALTLREHCDIQSMADMTHRALVSGYWCNDSLFKLLEEFYKE